MSALNEWKRARRRSINNREFLVAVCDNELKEITRLLDAGADINFKDADGRTSLSLAAEYGNDKVVRLLLDKGARLKIEDFNRETPLDIAKRLNRAEILEIFKISTNLDLQSEISDAAKISTSFIHSQKQTGVQRPIDSNKNAAWNNAVHGNIYQLKLLMLFLYRGVTCEYSFRLGTEIKEARKFDDLVFEYTQNNNKVYRLLQAKHKIDETKKITVDKLFPETNGDYSLVKYFHSYQACNRESFFKDGSIKDVTIYTNIDFDFDDLKKANIEVVKVEENDDILDVKSKSKNSMRYKFTTSIISKLRNKLQHKKDNSTTKSANTEIEDFFSHLVFAVNQPNEGELGEIIKKEIGKEADPSTTEIMYNKFFIRMLDCFEGRSNFMSFNEGKELFEEFRKSLFIWFNVHEPVKSFTGRLEVMENIHKLLQGQDNRLLCISGLGGVGKSELVKKYISEYSECYDNKIVWINAESYQTLVNSFCQLATDKLDISTTNADGKAKDVNSIISLVYQYFSKSKSLFIFDNAEMYRSSDAFDSGISQFLPSLPSGCNKPYIIITSRNQKWPESIKNHVLDGFTENEAVTFISQNLHLEIDEQNERIKQLGLKLQSLPLALQQAVAYIKSQNEDLGEVYKFQISDYLERFSGKSKEILNFEFPNHSDNKYSKTVFTTWNVTLDALKKTENGHEALNLLNFVAYLLPNDISEKTLLSFIQNEEKLISSIKLLQKYSFIQVQNRMLSIHRLVQQVTRIRLVETDQEKNMLERCLNVINNDNVNSKNISHFLSIWRHCRKYPEFYKEHVLASSTLTVQLITCGRSEEAHLMTAELTEILQESSPEDLQAQDYLACIGHNNGAALMAQGKYEEALKECQQSYEDHRRLRGPYDENTLISKSNMATVLMHLGRMNEASECQQQVLKDCTIYLGENHHLTLLAISNIAHCLMEQGRYEEGLSMAQAVYAKQKVVLGKYHEKTLITNNNIAGALASLNKYDEALKIHEEIYDYKKNNLAENHPSTLETRSNIATILSKQSNSSAALEIHKDLLENYRKMYGENHLLTLRTRGSIASILCDQGNSIAALKIFKNLLKSHRKIFGENHPETLMIQTEMAYALQESNELQEASNSFQELLVKQKGILGLNHPNFQRTLSGLASVLQRQGKVAESLKVYEELLQYQISLFGVNDVRTLDVRESIAKILMDDEKYDDALKRYSKIYEIQKDSFGANDQRTSMSKFQMAMIHLFKNQHDETLDSLEEIMEAQIPAIEKKCNNDPDFRRCIAVCQQIYKARHEAPSSKFTDPIVALQKNKLTFLEKSIKKGPDTNTKDVNTNPIMVVQRNKLNVLEKLIKEGVDVNTKDANEGTLLHHAVNLGLMKIIKFLLKNGADVTRTTAKGNTPLHMATSKGNLEVVKALLESIDHNKLHKFIDAKTCKSGSAALHIAAKNGFLEITRYLLSRGATHSLKNNENQLSVDLAMDRYVKNMLKDIGKLFKFANTGNKELINMLKRYSVDEYLAVINARNNQGHNLIQVAVTKYDHHLVGLFHDLTRKEFSSIYTTPLLNINLDRFLSLANSVVKATELAKLNLDQICDPVRNLVKKYNSNQNVIPNPNIEIIDDMLKLLESFTSAREFVELALHVIVYHAGYFITSIQSAILLKAANGNDFSQVKKLVYEGICVNVTDSGGWTPLHYATNVNNEKMVGLLLSKGARVNCITKTGKFTPLHIAVNKRNIELVKLLLRSHSSIELVDATTEAKGSTALHIAVEKMEPFITRLLLAHCANYQMKNKGGQAPVDITIAKFENNIAKVFLKLADELFIDVKNCNIEVIENLKGLDSEALMMSSRMRNSDGCNLMEVAVTNKHLKIADKIHQIFKTKLTKVKCPNTFHELCLT